MAPSLLPRPTGGGKRKLIAVAHRLHEKDRPFGREMVFIEQEWNAGGAVARAFGRAQILVIGDVRHMPLVASQHREPRVEGAWLGLHVSGDRSGLVIAKGSRKHAGKHLVVFDHRSQQVDLQPVLPHPGDALAHHGNGGLGPPASV